MNGGRYDGPMRLALILLFIHALPLPAELLVGRAQVKITPPVGVPMAGYYSIRLSEGTHDDLFAKAIAFDANGQRALLIACDLIGADPSYVTAARIAASEATQVPVERIMISGTHSHTGPLFNPRMLAAAPEAPRRLALAYIAQLPKLIAESARRAIADLQPALASGTIGQENSVSFNRRFLMKDGTVRFNPGKMNADIVRPVGPIDPELPVVFFESTAGVPLATYVNFALHLDTVGSAQYSADYPYTLAKILRAVKGADMLTLFTIGAAGNINHVDVRTKEAQKGDGEAARIGTVLAGEVIKSYARLKPMQAESVRAISAKVEVPMAAVTDEAKAKATVATFGGKQQAPFNDMVDAMKVLDNAERNGPLLAEVQVITLGAEVAWVAIPGEYFVELGMAIKRASPFPITIIVGQANGGLSYIPDRKAYAEGSYEAISARCAAGCGEMLVEAAIKQLQTLRR